MKTISHPLYRLGKKKAKLDKRTLMLHKIIGKAAIVPSEYSFDTAHPGVPLSMLGNDTYGDCVLVCRANQAMRQKFLEEGEVLKITEKDVLREYFKETGGEDTGLVILDSLKQLRNVGWTAANRHLQCKTFASVNLADRSHLQQVIYADVGAWAGIELPASAQDELDSGKPWSKTSGTGTAKGSWGGHCVFIVGYTKIGPVCITWGQRQQMTWAWFAKYCDEVYAVIDDLNTSKKKKLFSESLITDYLKLHAA